MVDATRRTHWKGLFPFERLVIIIHFLRRALDRRVADAGERARARELLVIKARSKRSRDFHASRLYISIARCVTCLVARILFRQPVFRHDNCDKPHPSIERLYTRLSRLCPSAEKLSSIFTVFDIVDESEIACAHEKQATDSGKYRQS